MGSALDKDQFSPANATATPTPTLRRSKLAPALLRKTTSNPAILEKSFPGRGAIVAVAAHLSGRLGRRVALQGWRYHSIPRRQSKIHLRPATAVASSRLA